MAWRRCAIWPLSSAPRTRGAYSNNCVVSAANEPDTVIRARLASGEVVAVRSPGYQPVAAGTAVDLAVRGDLLAYPAPHFAVADGGAAGQAAGLGSDYGFVYLNLRMARGRSAAVHADVGSRLEAVAKAHFAPLLASRPVGVTLQIDEGHEVFDAKHSNLHPLFKK